MTGKSVYKFLTKISFIIIALTLSSSAFAMGAKRPGFLDGFEKASSEAEKTLAQIQVAEWVIDREMKDSATGGLVKIVQGASFWFSEDGTIMIDSRAIVLIPSGTYLEYRTYDNDASGLVPERLQRVLDDKSVQVALVIADSKKGHAPDPADNKMRLALVNPGAWDAPTAEAIGALKPIVRTAGYEYMIFTFNPNRPNELKVDSYDNEDAKPENQTYVRSYYP